MAAVAAKAVSGVATLYIFFRIFTVIVRIQAHAPALAAPPDASDAAPDGCKPALNLTYASPRQRAS